MATKPYSLLIPHCFPARPPLVAAWAGDKFPWQCLRHCWNQLFFSSRRLRPHYTRVCSARTIPWTNISRSRSSPPSMKDLKPSNHGGSWGRMFCLASLVVNMAPQRFSRPNGITTYNPPSLPRCLAVSVLPNIVREILHKVSFPTCGKRSFYHPTKPSSQGKSLKNYHTFLVGGCNQPHLKNMSQHGSFPQGSGWTYKKSQLPPAR